MTNHTTELYFESHVTIDPVEETEILKYIAGSWKFRIARLFKRNGDPHTDDMFMTARSGRYSDIEQRTVGLVDELRNAGFNVRRWKIENTLLDTKLQPELL